MHLNMSMASAGQEISGDSSDEPEPVSARCTYYKRLESGAAVARLDAGDIVWLSRALADLFETLRKDARENDGVLIDLKERETVQMKLGLLAHRAVGRKALRTRMTRLRDTLEAAGYSRGLVECSRDGMRIRLKRRPA